MANTRISSETGIDKVKDGTITQADLAPNVAGNGPAFSAYQSTLQSVPNDTATKVQLQSEEFDTANAFDSTTNYRFQPLVAGYYQVNGGVLIQSTVGSCNASVYKTGSIYKLFTNAVNDASNVYSYGSCLVYLNGSTDYVELMVKQNTGASKNTLTGLAYTYFQGYLARVA